MVDPAPGALLSIARALAREAGDIVLEGFATARHSAATKSSLTDLVTDVDRAVERCIVAGLGSARPDDALLGEEGTATEGRSGVQWVIDPIDGTTNYVYGHPGFAVSIAAEHHGRALAGVVLDPLRDEEFAATVGEGATLNGSPITVSGSADLATALVATGFGYGAERRAEQAALLVHVLPHIRDIRRVGSAALDLCSVACGRVDGYYELGVNHWDVAAGTLIAREAGALVRGLDEGSEPLPWIVAATPSLAEPLAALLQAGLRRAAPQEPGG